MKTLKRVIISLLLISVYSCSHRNCFDKELYEKHKNDGCTQDCPGVTGCDGNTYCNECIANSKGIHVRK